MRLVPGVRSPAAAGIGVAVLVGLAGCGGGTPSQPAAAAVAATPTRGPGWNLAGGSLSAQPPVAPAAVPRGSVGGRGEAARPAGPADYVGVVPTSLRLPSGSTALIRPAGVHRDGSLAVPDDPQQVGWWTGGAAAGERYGNVVIAGHVDSARFGVGVLAELRSARKGQRLQLSGQGRSVSYRVTSVRVVKKAKLTAGNAVFAQNRPQRLVLITCGGPFDRRTHRYQDNVVIEADPV